MDKKKLKLLFFIIIIICYRDLLSEAETSQDWKAKLSAVLTAQGKLAEKRAEFLKALHYYERAIELDSNNSLARRQLEHIKAYNLSCSENEKKVLRRSGTPEYEEAANNIIVAQYLGISQQETYPAWKRGPTINTVLDIYHPEHEGKKFPYYKNYEGFKLNKYLGIWANYEIEKKPVGLETLILDAKEFARYSEEQLREYVSTNDKEFWDWELRYFYKDYWPKIIYKYHTADTRRQYAGKLVWSDNPLYSENEDYHEIKLDYTFRNLKFLGYLKIEPFFRFTKWTSDNDASYLAKEKRYEIRVSTMPFDDLEFIFEYTYLKNKKTNHPNIGGEILDAIRKSRYYIETIRHIPNRRLKLSASYLYRAEEWVPTEEKWPKHELKIYWEKNFTSRLKLRQDLEYIRLEREKQPHTANYIHLSSQWLAFKNKISKELIKDLTVSLEYEYGSGLDFSGFDYHNIDAEIELFKPGLIRTKFGTGYTYFYNIDDHLWSLYLKFSESAPFSLPYLFQTRWGGNSLGLTIGAQRLKYKFQSSDGSSEGKFITWNSILNVKEEVSWSKCFLGLKLSLPLWLDVINGDIDIDATSYNAQNLQYNWKQLNLYGGIKPFSFFQPYLGLSWSKEKLHWSDVRSAGSLLNAPGTRTKKALSWLLGVKGEKLFNKLTLSYCLEYTSSFDSEVFTDSSLIANVKFQPAVKIWSAGLGIDYRIINNLDFFLNTHYGKTKWDGEVKNALVWSEEEIKFLELMVGLKWLF